MSSTGNFPQRKAEPRSAFFRASQYINHAAQKKEALNDVQNLFQLRKFLYGIRRYAKATCFQRIHCTGNLSEELIGKPPDFRRISEWSIARHLEPVGVKRQFPNRRKRKLCRNLQSSLLKWPVSVNIRVNQKVPGLKIPFVSRRSICNAQHIPARGPANCRHHREPRFPGPTGRAIRPPRPHDLAHLWCLHCLRPPFSSYGEQRQAA